jgi:UDP-galactopyranose mutase
MNHDIAVLGGGLAGLCAGMQAGAPVFEAADHPGGVAASDSVDGFTFDRGIHVLQSKNQKIYDLIAKVGVRLESRERDAHIYSHGCYTAYPFQVNTVGLPLLTRIRCVRDFLRRPVDDEPANYEQWMYSNIGHGLAEIFLIPYSEKFWGVHPRELTHDWTGNRVPKPSTLQVLRGAVWSRRTKVGTNATFQYPVGGGGYGAVATALAGHIDQLHLQHAAVGIDPLNRRVRFSNGRVLNYRVLVNSIPLPTLVKLMECEVPSAVREAVAKLRTNSIFIVNLGIDRPMVSDRHWVHFPEKDVSFFRISYPTNFDHAVAPPGTSAISAEVAYTPSNPVDRETIVERVIADLVRVGAMRANERIIVKSTQDIPLAYCIYDQSRKESVRIIAKWLYEHDIITCGRYGLWSYFWSDESMTSGMKAADKAVGRLRDMLGTGTNADSGSARASA